jgi:hypothetical protein
VSRLLAIDPGNTESAYVIIDETCRPGRFDKIRNDDMLALIEGSAMAGLSDAVIEMVASYGMAVGADVFETCVWIGRFYQVLEDRCFEPGLIKRHPIKLHHCHSANAKDSNITQALVDRFAPGQPNHGKGTKASPGWFYGFKSDIWAAYALAVYAMDTAEGVAA